MKLFPNSTSIPLDYLLISWGINYAHNRQGFDLFIASRTPSIEKFKAHRLAKVHIFLSETMKNLVGSFYHALTISSICNRQQNTPDSEFLLEKYQSKSLGKGLSAFYPANSLNRAPRCSIEQGSEGFTNAFKIRAENLF